MSFLSNYREALKKLQEEEEKTDSTLKAGSKTQTTTTTTGGVDSAFINSYRSALSKLQEENTSFTTVGTLSNSTKVGTSSSSTKVGTSSSSTDKKWYESGLFEDGYDFGDIAKTLLGVKDDSASLLDLTLNSAKRGYYNSLYGEESYKAMTGASNKSDVYKQILESDKYQFTPGNTLAEGVSGAFELLGQMGRQFTNPRTGALALGAGGAAAIAGQAGPQVLAPEEIVTVPVAAAAGWMAGVAGNTYEIEAGHAYNEMIEAGIKEETARKIAIGVGAVNATLEAAQVDELVDAFKVLNKTGTNKSVVKKIVNELADRGIDIAKETAQEVVQEGVTIAGVQAGSKMDTGEYAYSADDVKERLADVAKSSALSFGMMNVPATAKNTFTIAKDQAIENQANKLTDMEQTVADKLVEKEITKRESDGKTVSAQDKKKIQNTVEENLRKGYLKAEDIEEVLGGESYNTFKAERDTFFNSDAYKNYTKDTKRIEKLQKQLKDLENEPNTVGNSKKYDAIQTRLDILTKRNEAAKATLNTEAERIRGIRDQMRSQVMGTVKDSRLAESFRELARKQQKFQVDINKYTNENAKKTVQSILDSGLGDNSNQFHDVVDFLAKISEDKNVTFNLTNNAKLEGTEHYKKGYITHGFINDNGDIVLNKDSDRVIQTTVGHEVTHVLEKAGIYKELSAAVRDFAISKEGLEKYNARLAAAQEAYAGKKNTTAEKEITADLIGEYLFTDSEFVNKLSTSNRNVFQKIYDEIKYLCKVVTAGSKEARELEKVKKLFDKAWRENVKGKNDSKDSVSAEATVDPENDADLDYESPTKYSVSVKDPKTIDFLENQEHITTYKAMVMIDGKLYPPMASKVKGENGKYQLTNGRDLGEWMQAEEDTTNIKFNDKGVGYYDLKKDDGGTVRAAYNPYEHSSNLVLNDQFEAAYKRGNLVTVECVIPKSEIDNPYKAEYAKDSTGMMDWHSGTVAGKLTDNKRSVYLSRYLKAVRIVPDSEVAQMYKDIVGDLAVPFNVVSPSLLTELENAGVNIDYDGSPQYQYLQRRAAEKEAKKNTRYSISGKNAKTADYFKLDTAIKMEDIGKATSEEIRQETGWFKGYDGEWRFEISDRDMDFNMSGHFTNPDILRYKELENKFITDTENFTEAEEKELRSLSNALKGVKKTPKDLGDYLKHDKLFEAYPQLKDIRVRFDYLSDGELGAYKVGQNEIVLNYNLRDNKAKLERTLIHEIQHAIQEIEGFAGGSSIQYWERQKSDIVRTIKGARENLDLWLADIGYSDYVKTSMQEVVSGQKTMDQHWSDLKEFKENSIYAEQIANCEAELAEYQRQYDETINGMTAFELYENTAGEIEARDVENRSWRSEFALKETRPDIDRTNVVFTEDDKRPRYSVSKATDKDYLDAVNFGDMDDAQQMVDAAAKESGYTRRMFHETNAENIHIFDISRGDHGGTDSETPYGIFTKTSRRRIGLGDNQMALYVKADKTLNVENRADVKNKIPELVPYYDELASIDKKYNALAETLEDAEFDALMEWMDEHPDADMDVVYPNEYIIQGKPADIDSQKYLNAFNARKQIMDDWKNEYNNVAIQCKELITSYLRGNGYDSMYFKVDAGSFGRQTDSLIVLDPNQVKSANPVTYDDSGDVIPLSERFKADNDDIRYSMTKAEVEKEYQFNLDNNDMAGAEAAVEQMANLMMPDSKIRDKKGRLIPVYHGTNADFWEFDTSADGGKNGTAEGFGIYLSDNQDVTNAYGDRQIKMFANITKPATSFKKTIKASTLVKLIKQTCERQAQMMVEEEGYDSIREAIRDTWVSNYVDTYGTSMDYAYREVAQSMLEQNDNDKDIIHEVMFGMAIRSYDQAMDFYKNSLTPITGIDGFITKWDNANTGEQSNIYLAFDSSQLKSADAVTYDEYGDAIPLSERFDSDSKDIRYSMAKEGEENTYGDFRNKWSDFGYHDELDDFAPIRDDSPKVYERSDLFPENFNTPHMELDNLNQEKEALENSMLDMSNSGDFSDMPRVDARWKAVRNRITELEKEISDTDSERFNSISDEDAPPEMDAPYYGDDSDAEVPDPFADRDMHEVGSKKVKAYQYENPEVKPYFTEAALGMLDDLRSGTKGERLYNDELHYESGGEKGWMGTKRHTTPDIAALLDQWHYTYAEIEKGLNAIIEDDGKENNAVSKRIEFMLHDRLVNGYTGVWGEQIPPNQEYIDFLRDREISEYSREAFDSFMETADMYAPADEDFAPIREDVAKNAKNAASEAGAYNAKATADKQEAVEEKTPAQRRREKSKEYTEFWSDLIGDTSTWKDMKTGLQYKTKTLRRILRHVVKDGRGNPDIRLADDIYDELETKYDHNEALLKKESAKLKEVFKNLKLSHAEDQYAQMLGELRYNPETTLTEDVVKEFLKKHKGINEAKVNKAIKESRKLYDDLIVRVNEVLKEQGFKEIPYRQGYFPHFTNPKQNWVGKLLNWKTIDTEIPTSIAGLTEMFKPNRSWQKFNKQRMGDKTDYSLYQGLDTYIHGALDWIYHIEDLQKRRSLENYIRYTHSEEGVKQRINEILNSDYDADEAQIMINAVLDEANNPLSGLVRELMNRTNTLANKKSAVDRGMEDMLNRKIYSTMTNLNNRITANMVVGSFSSAMTNFIPMVQSWHQVSPWYTVRGIGDTVRAAIKDDGTIAKSDFLTNRLMEEENLYKTGWDKASNAAAFMMNAIDNITSQTVWRSKYLQNLREGMSEAQAIRDADQFAKNLMAGRSRGNAPSIFDAKNPLVKIFTAFQLEVANQYGYMFEDVPQDSKNMVRMLKGYATAFLGAYAYNALYSTLVGRDAAFDPISIIEDLMKGLLDDDDEEDDLTDDIMDFGKNVLEEVPFVGGLMGGGRIPLSSAFPYSGYSNPIESMLTDLSEGELSKEWLKPLYYLVLPFGGGQLKKTNEGLGMFSEDHPIAGSYTASGNLRFPVEDTIGNRIQAAMFGQYANENARDYFDNDRSALYPDQIEEFVDLDVPIRDYWEYLDGLKDLKKKDLNKQSDKLDYINSLDLTDSQKNILKSNLFDEEGYAKENPEKYAFLKREGIGFLGYKQLDSDTQDAWSWAFNHQDEYNFLKENGVLPGDYSVYRIPMLDFDNEKDEAYEWAYKYPQYHTLSKAITDDVREYRDWYKDISALEADKDKNGKSISGSKKAKVIDYINSLDIEYGAKLVLFKSQYEDDDTYNEEIFEYIRDNKALEFEEKLSILKTLGFGVSDDGTITWD